jgi:hypothetical protein
MRYRESGSPRPTSGIAVTRPCPPGLWARGRAAPVLSVMRGRAPTALSTGSKPESGGRQVTGYVCLAPADSDSLSAFLVPCFDEAHPDVVDGCFEDLSW